MANDVSVGVRLASSELWVLEAARVVDEEESSSSSSLFWPSQERSNNGSPKRSSGFTRLKETSSEVAWSSRWGVSICCRTHWISRPFPTYIKSEPPEVDIHGLESARNRTPVLLSFGRSGLCLIADRTSDGPSSLGNPDRLALGSADGSIVGLEEEVGTGLTRLVDVRRGMSGSTRLTSTLLASSLWKYGYASVPTQSTASTTALLEPLTHAVHFEQSAPSLIHGILYEMFRIHSILAVKYSQYQHVPGWHQKGQFPQSNL